MDRKLLVKSIRLGIIIFIIAKMLAYSYSSLLNKFMTYGMLGISTTRDLSTGSLLFALYFLQPISLLIMGQIMAVTKILNHPHPSFNPIILEPLNLLFWILLSLFIISPAKRKKSAIVITIGTFFILIRLFWLPNLFMAILKRFIVVNKSLFYAYFTTITAIISIASGIGLLLLKRWGWVSSFILSLIMCIVSLRGAWIYYPLRPHKQILGLASVTPYYLSMLQLFIFLLLVFILTRPKVKEQFKKEALPT